MSTTNSDSETSATRAPNATSSVEEECDSPELVSEPSPHYNEKQQDQADIETKEIDDNGPLEDEKKSPKEQQPEPEESENETEDKMPLGLKNAFDRFKKGSDKDQQFNPFDDDSFTDEHNNEEESELPDYPIRGDDESSAVMSASEMPIYDSAGRVVHSVISVDTDSDDGADSALTPNQSNASVNGNSQITESYASMLGHTRAESEASTTMSEKRRSTNYQFKRGVLISGEAPKDAGSNPFADASKSDESDVESGPPSSDFASKAPRSLWHDLSIESAEIDSKRVEGVIAEEDDESVVVVEEKKATGDDENERPDYRELLSKYRAIAIEKSQEYREVIVEKSKVLMEYAVQYRSILAGVGVFVLIVIIISIIVAVTKNKKGRRGDNGASMEATHDKIRDSVATIVDEAVLADQTTPEAQALKWLTNDDAVWTHEHEEFSEDRIIQRFVLVSFYLSMGGPLWIANNWLQDDECKWNFLDCNGKGEVRALAFDNVGLEGEIPDLIAHLKKLKNFIIKKEPGVVGGIPGALGHLKELQQLGIYYTNLQGSIPRELFLSTSIKYINFQNNNLDGGLPLEVGQLSKLEKLILMNNGLSGEIPWGNLSATPVTFLGLSKNKFHGHIDFPEGGFASLEFLYLDANELDGSLPSSIGGIHSLRSINIDNNRIGGQLPVEIGFLVNLEYFSMQYNELEGAIPTEIRDMTALKTIGLGSNKLNGNVPNIQTLVNLENLYLFDNQLTGQVNDAILNHPSLKVLFLSSNILSGNLPVPDPTTMNSQLIGLYLSDNHFDGEIPLSFCNLRALQALFLDENYLAGNLPGCLGMLKQLTQLHVFKNELIGFVPYELSVLHNLQELGVEGNELWGKVPDGLCRTVDENKIDFWSDCAGDNPEVECECCSTCCTRADECGPK